MEKAHTELQIENVKLHQQPKKVRSPSNRKQLRPANPKFQTRNIYSNFLNNSTLFDAADSLDELSEDVDKHNDGDKHLNGGDVYYNRDDLVDRCKVMHVLAFNLL